MPAWISKAGGNSRARRQAVRDSLAESYLKQGIHVSMSKHFPVQMPYLGRHLSLRQSFLMPENGKMQNTGAGSNYV